MKLSTPKYNNIKIAANACASAINSPNRTVVLSLSPSNNSTAEEEIISIGEEEEIPHKVVDEDFETGSYEKEDEKKESEQNYVSVNESIEMDVETQGIPMEQLLAKGKSMFSHVNFNK